ncbi:MAG: thioredoxin domain-containing protein [Planctomycetota bacterium]|jgi:uncharacterized protein YyaL (SSP411 family)
MIPISIAFVLLVGGSAARARSDDAKPRHTNRLIDASSPYLLQHAHNPVDWYPWSEEAFAKAVAEDKPVFLSIGYAACHWCHVMERESFENEEIAAVLNENFVCIKVDREERPDIDELYMAATQAATGRGGWPMSVFMTPQRKPFLCGTYFPPETRGGRRGFRSICVEIVDKWKNSRRSLLDDAQSLLGKVRRNKRIVAATVMIDRNTLSRNVDRIARGFDEQQGGRRSRRNKFPPTMAMELMLREYATQPEVSKPELVELVDLTLTRMARGGIFDHLGGGICRYSTDPRWFAPHFEKMLYDQGTVSGVYLSAYQLTKKPLFAQTARSILDYCLADLQDEGGGFYSSRDADSEGEEGKFYVWTQDELLEILGAADGRLFCAYYNVRPGGNWHHGQNILHITDETDVFAERHGMTADEWSTKIAALNQKVFQARENRVHPGLDDKILTEWNALLINSLARAYRILGDERYRVAAEKAAGFIQDNMVIDGRLYRAHRNGKTYVRGNAADYANLIEALITLYETTGNERWLDAAVAQSEKFIELFEDRRDGGFFYTAHDAEKLIVRSKNTRDGVVPSCNSTAAMNFQRLAVMLDKSEWQQLAEQAMVSLGSRLANGTLERMAWSALFHFVPPKEIAIIGAADDPHKESLINQVYADYLPNKVVMIATPDAAAKEDAVPLLRRKTLVDGKAGAYVCRDYKCGLPVNAPEKLARQLAGN